MNSSITNLLYRSFDTSLSLKDQFVLNDALITSVELTEERRQVEKLRTALRELSVQSFSEQFVGALLYRLSENIDSNREYWETTLWAFRRIVIVAMLMLAIFGSYNLYAAQSISLDALFRFTFWETADITQVDTFQW